MTSDFWPTSSRAVSLRSIHAVERPFKGRQYSFNEHLVFFFFKTSIHMILIFKTLTCKYMHARVSVYGYGCLSTGAKRRPEGGHQQPLL